VKHERIAPPGHVLPAAEVIQQLRSSRLPHQREIIEPAPLEEAAKSTLILHLARNEQAPCSRREAGKLDIAFLRIVHTG